MLNPSAAPQPGRTPEPSDPPAPAGETKEAWSRAGGRLLAKMLSEFAYEEIIRPTPREPDGTPSGTTPSDATPSDATPDGATPAGATPPDMKSPAGTEPPAGRDPDRAGPPEATAPPAPDTRSAPHSPTGTRPEPTIPSGAGRSFCVGLDDGARIAFRARRGAYGGWRVDPGSIALVEGEGPARPFTDPLAFLVRARRSLGVDGITLGHVIRELSHTLAADVRLERTAFRAAELADLGYAELEGHQTGHPWLVLNKGRLGFSADDTAHWAPESREPAILPWIAVHTSMARYRGVFGLDTADRLYAQELDPATREAFADVLRARRLAPGEYLYLPVHPWQWDEIVLPLFGASVAADRIVPLPTDGDLRLPQQSIRTFCNVSHPARHTVKLPLSILNTLVWRGLPTERTLAAPAVTAWMQGLRDADPFLKDECGVILLGEVASVTVEHPVYDALPEVPYQFRELLGAIWREPLLPQLAVRERARTLAALLHTDPDGRAVVAELVARSGLPPRVWLRHLFAALLPPLLRYLYHYGVVFSPHGENAIVVFDEQDVPVRLAVKDFVDDVNVSAHPLPELALMPDDVRAVLLTEPPEFLTQFIHSGLFVGVFRYLAPLCEEQLGVPEAEFWSLVRAEIVRHQERFPQLKDRYALFDLLTPRIERLCLNRNRLHLDGYRDRAQRPHAAVHGSVANPLHRP